MSINSIISQIQNANALGRSNLSLKGVNLSETATTYEIMQSIADVTGGEVEFTNIVYNEDNTITLTDKDGTTHTMVCTYDGDRLLSVTYDGEYVSLSYEGDTLVAVGGTDIDLSNAPSNDNIMIFKEVDSYSRPMVVDLTQWTPASFGYNESVYVNSKCVPAHTFHNGNGYGMYINVNRFVLPKGINAVSNQGFYYCGNWVYSADDFDMSELTLIGDKAFAYCSSLGIVNLNLPKLKKMGSEAFSGVLAANNSLVTGDVVLGSPGNPVTSVGSSAFKFQDNITSITVYTEGGAELTYAPWGAENATINYISA